MPDARNVSDDDAPATSPRKPRAAKARTPRVAAEPLADATVTSQLPAVAPEPAASEPGASGSAAPAVEPVATVAPVGAPSPVAPPVAPPAVPPAVPAAPGDAATPAGPPREARAPRAPRQPRAPRAPQPAPSYAVPPTATATNPLAGIPASDYLRDVAAAVLLLASLGLRWDTWRDASDRIDVVLITLLSVFSLAAAYLARLGALGEGWSLARIRLVRLLLNAPYLVMVVVYLVLDLVRGGELGIEGGVGTAVGVGLAGALLAAQPREAEAEAGDGTTPAWRWAIAAIGVVAAAGAVGGLVATLVREGEGMWLTTVLWTILVTLITLVLVVGPIVGTVARSAPWRLVLLAVGGGAVVLLAAADGGAPLGGDVESVHGIGFGFVLWSAAAAAAAAPGVRRAMVDHGPRARWIGAAVQLLTLVIVVCGLQAALLVVRLTDSIDRGRGAEVTSLVLVVAYLVAALIARTALAQNQPQGRATAFVVAAALFLIGLVNLAVISAADRLDVGYLEQLFALVVPVALAIMVAVPAVTDGRRPAASGGPTTSLPVRPGPAAADLGHRAGAVPETIRLATDPTTSPEALAGLAASAPEARAYVAAHPNAYPALLGWLAHLGDPAVDDALRRRPR